MSKQIDTGKIPEEWVLDQLREYLELITYGFTNPMPESLDGPFMITAKDIHGGRIDFENCRKTTGEAYRKLLTDKSRPKINDILLTKDGTLGRVALVTRGNCCINQSVALLRPNRRIFPVFLKYLLEAPFYQRKMESDADGTVIKHIYITRVDKMLVAVPPISEQESIARILSDFDGKIELNHLINRTVEAIGQTLFKHWFVDFEFPNEEGKPYKSSGGGMVDSEFGEIPKRWNVRPFSEAIEVNPSRELPKGTLAKKVGMADLSSWQSWIESWQLEEYKSGPRFRNGDTLFARITPSLEHGKTAFVSFLDSNEVAFGSTEFIIMAPKIIPSSLYVYHLAISDYVRKAAISAMTGSSGRQRVPEDLLDHLMVHVPPHEIVEKFHTNMARLFDTVTINAYQNRTLSSIREAILPKLTSGEIRVGNNS